jgi:diaminopimelate epimerase
LASRWLCVLLMTIPFSKMHGAGNDFVVVDDRDGTFPCADAAWLRATARRRTGVGADGFILLQAGDDSCTFRMRIFNADGGEAEMCANGARCAARYAVDRGIAAPAMRMATGAGVIAATVHGDGVQLAMTEPADWQLDRRLRLGDDEIAYSYVNTGVPHTVIECADVAAVSIGERGSAVRHHTAFAPSGTNVNFVEVRGPNALALRTYERGVEAETLACGTGVVASALVATRLRRVQLPVDVLCASGDHQRVDGCFSGDSFRDVTLHGPTAYAFDGTLRYTGGRS